VGGASADLADERGVLDQILIVLGVIDVIPVGDKIAQVFGMDVTLARRVALGFLIRAH
jgi:hypothetical protein